MNYYPFKKFKLNKKHLFPILNKKDLYPQHKTTAEKEILNQVFEGVKVDFIKSKNLLIPSRRDDIYYAELTLTTGEIIRIKNELFSEHIKNITIKKGLIEEPLIFIADGFELNIVFEGEPLFPFYHTELLSQGSSEIFKTKEKDLSIGSVCSIISSEEADGTFTYCGKYYYKMFKNMKNYTNNKGEYKEKLVITNFRRPCFVFEYLKDGVPFYLLKKDLNKVHKHLFSLNEQVSEAEEIYFDYDLISKNEEEVTQEKFFELLKTGKLSSRYFTANILDNKNTVYQNTVGTFSITLSKRKK